MQMHNSPCYKCEERTAECHATCERYRKAKEEHEQLKQSSFKEKQAMQDFLEIMRRRNRK